MYKFMRKKSCNSVCRVSTRRNLNTDFMPLDEQIVGEAAGAMERGAVDRSPRGGVESMIMKVVTRCSEKRGHDAPFYACRRLHIPLAANTCLRTICDFETV